MMAERRRVSAGRNSRNSPEIEGLKLAVGCDARWRTLSYYDRAVIDDLPSAGLIAAMSPEDRRFARAGLLYAAEMEATAAEVIDLPGTGVGPDEPLPMAPDDWCLDPPASAYRLANTFRNRVAEIGRALRTAAGAALRALVELAAGHLDAGEPEPTMAERWRCQAHGPAPPPVLTLATDIARHGPPGRPVAPPSIGAGPARAA